jgi:chromosome partitioning protein
MKKLAVFNNKGGVGKSTISVQLAHGLALAGYKVLLVDMDNQNDCSLMLGISEDSYKETFFNLIDKRYPAKLEDCVIEARSNLDLLPNSEYDIIKSEFHREPNLNVVMGYALEDAEKMGYDYIIVDCSPEIGRINDAVLYYVDDLIVPVQLEAASIKGVKNIYQYLDRLRISNDKIKLIVPNMMDKRTNESKENLEKLMDAFDGLDIVANPISRRTKITEASNEGKTIYEYDEEAKKQFYDVLRRVSNFE